MVRKLDSAALRKPVRNDRKVASSTGRAVGAALACLLVTSLVVDRSVGAIHPGAAGSGTAFTAAAIELSDDDEGRSLVNLANMVPGEVEYSCITVTYEGTLLPATLTLGAEVTGSLNDFVEVSIEEGESATFKDCEGYRPIRDIYSGTLAGLADQEIVVADLVSAEETRTFRFGFEISDTSAAIGKSAGADFIWEVIP